MAKNSKKSRETGIAQSGPGSDASIANNPGKETPVGLALGKIPGSKSSKTTRKTKVAGKNATRPPGKTERTRKTGVTHFVQSARSPKIEISDDDIRLRAYFIAERRMQSGMPGDSTNDWWEAHRQLQEEASQNN
jgi:DUF2934 family protein